MDSRPEPDVRVRRIYDPPGEDGLRVLVDRLWPRGVRRESAHIDAWLKDLAPSSALRTWFHHDPSHWAQFRRRYRAELAAQRAQIEALRQAARERPVTLLYGARDPEHNHALVLREVIAGAAPRKAAARSGARGAGQTPRRGSVKVRP